jgi:hypothetical protein
VFSPFVQSYNEQRSDIGRNASHRLGSHEGQVRSWTFDSGSGFGQGRWIKDGESQAGKGNAEEVAIVFRLFDKFVLAKNFRVPPLRA